MFETILYTVDNKICIITLNRPEKRNAFNARVVTELTAAFEQADQDESVKVIILKAAGKIFSA